MIRLCTPRTMHNGIFVKESTITSTLTSEVMILPKFSGGLQSLHADVAGRKLLLELVNTTIRHGNAI